MNRFLLLLLLSTGFSSAFSQKNGLGTVKGHLTDTAYHETMADATVSVMAATDSTMISYIRADEKGMFVIKNLNAGSYRLIVSFQGYQPVTRKFSISATITDVDMGTINMNKASDMLEEVIVERPPITIKGDTVEFSASAFKTKPNAVAEDLLKKLPGVEVDKDGNITAQGETIQKVYVNGKEFFGSDPKMATKNITADMIESVQVFDDMSEQAKFTRIDDGSRSKTINIKLKKGMDKGYFGRGNIGYGTEDRYSGSLMMNRFQGDNRLSLIASSNNINKQGFNSRDIVGGMGGFTGGGGGRGGGGMARTGGGGGGRGGQGGPPAAGGAGSTGASGGTFGGSGSGLTKATNIGLNYSNTLGKLSLTGSYMFGQTDSKTYQTSYSENRIPSRDSTSYETDTSSSVTKNINHNFNLKLEYAIDSMNSLIYTPNFIIQNSDDHSFGNNFIRAVKPGVNYQSLSGVNENANKRDGLTLNNELLFRHRFSKFGRTLTLGYKSALNNSKGSGYTYSPITYYNPYGGEDSIQQRDYLTSQTTRSANNLISSSYTEPVGAHTVLEVNYAYTNNTSTSDREGLNYNTVTGKYDSLNLQQTNYFKNNFQAHRLGFNYRYKTTLYGFQLGGAVQSSQQDNNSTQAIYRVNGKDSVIHTNQAAINFFPTANFNYDFNRRKNIQFKYQGRTNQPSVKQLQDVRDETDALSTVVGNPGLKQEFANKLNISYKTFNETTYRYLNVNVNYEQTSNKIVNSIDLDTSRGSGIQLTKPINLNGAYMASYDISFSIPLREKMKGSSINLSNTMKYDRGVSRQYGENSFTNTFTASQSAGINLDVQQKLNMEFKGRFSYNSVTYTAQAQNSVSQNTKYFTQNYSTNINYYIRPTLILSTDFDYAINSGRSAGYNTSIPLWNGGLAYQMFKKKNGELKLSVNDILNQNSNITRTIGINSYSDTRTVILQRYYMLTFTYSFNRFGKNAQRPGPGDFRRPEGGPGGGMWRGGGGGNREEF